MKKVIVYITGTFDLFHYGHLNILLESKKLGDVLIVGVSTDKLVKKINKIKPIIDYKRRASIVKELKCVDKVIQQKIRFDAKQLEKYNINIVVMGSDWKTKSFPELKKFLKITKTKVIYIPYTKHISSSEIKEKIIRNSYNIVKNQIKKGII